MSIVTNSVCGTTQGVVLTNTTGQISIGNTNNSGTIVINSGALLDIYSSSSVIQIGVTGGTQIIIGSNAATSGITLRSGTGPITIGTDASAKTITIGNVTGATSVVINSGTGAINIGTSIAKTITMGNTTGATSLIFNTGSGGINMPSFTTTGALVSNTSGLITDANASTTGFVLTSNGASTPPSFQAAASGGTTWNDQNSSTVTMAAKNGYVIDNGASLVTLTLPTTAALGDEYQIVGKSSGGWTVAQNSGQTINMGSSPTTAGVGGSLSSTNQYDCVMIICITANTTFVVKSSFGNLTVV